MQAVRPGSTLNNLGVSGHTSDDLINIQLAPAITHLNQASGTTVAVVWIGSNDLFGLYMPVGTTTVEEEAFYLQNFTTNIETILNRLEQTGAKLFIALLDDQSKRPCITTDDVFKDVTAEEATRMSQQVTLYNQAIQSKASQHGATIVDFYNTTIFTNPATLSGDGNHPNGAGYDIIATMWFDKVFQTN
jgi:lysophospholipase L1-like esterase